jgi:hypothetical protein
MDDDGGSSLDTIDRRTLPFSKGGAELRTVCRNNTKR